MQRFYQSKEESNTKGTSKGFVRKRSISKWYVFKIMGMNNLFWRKESSTEDAGTK